MHNPRVDSSASAEGAQQRRDPSVLFASHWNQEAWLLHGFSTRLRGVTRLSSCEDSWGDLNLGYTSNEGAEAVSLNRQRFLSSIATARSSSRNRFDLVTLKQMHSGLVRRVGREDVGERASLWGDGLMTDQPGVWLGIQTADCLPILIADRRKQAVAALHAGWRGTLKGIVEQGISSMRREFGSRPEDLVAAIGPGIGSCCFAVGEEVERLFAARYSYARQLFTKEKQLHLNLTEANRRQLLSAGLSPGSISSLDLCTSCRTDWFFSYRAERGKTGRMMAVIGVKPA